MMKPNLRVLSLGGGVQSSTMAIMADQHVFGEPPDFAVFADTGWEAPETYEMIDWLKQRLSYPVHVVSKSNLRDDLEHGVNSTGHKFPSIPAHTVNMYTNKTGMMRRQCTKEYKLLPIVQKIRAELGMKPKQKVPKTTRVEMWLGISKDEITRMRDSRYHYIENRWPLIERSMSRDDCKQWWADNAPDDVAPSRSACVGCPFHTSQEWIEIADKHPGLLKDAARLEAVTNHKVRSGMIDEQHLMFYHRRRIPLLEAVKLDQQQAGADASQLDLFEVECEGMCGV